MIDDNFMVTLGLRLNEVDVILNALQEKSIAVDKLRNDIYQNVSAQISVAQSSQENVNEEDKEGNN